MQKGKEKKYGGKKITCGEKGGHGGREEYGHIWNGKKGQMLDVGEGSVRKKCGGREKGEEWNGEEHGRRRKGRKEGRKKKTE